MDQESLNKNQESTFTTKTEHIQRVQHENIEETKTTNSTSQSTGTADYCEGVKSFLRDLYDILVCEKLPATDDSLNSSAKSKETNEEFINILEILCENVKSLDCDKKSEVDDKDINTDYMIIGKDINEEKVQKFARNYVKLMKNENLMKLLFHKHHPACDSGGSEKFFSQIKNFQSKANKYIFNDLCEVFEIEIEPKIQILLHHHLQNPNHVWFFKENFETRSIINSSYVNIGLCYVLYQIITDNYFKLEIKELEEISKKGFIKMSPEIQSTSSHFLRIIDEKYPTVIDRLTVNKEEFSNDHMEALRNFDILMVLDEGVLNYYIKRMSPRWNETQHMQSKYFVKIPVVQNWDTENFKKFLMTHLKFNELEIEAFEVLSTTGKIVLSWSRYRSYKHPSQKYVKSEVKVGFSTKIDEREMNTQLMLINFRFHRKIINEVSFDFIYTLYPFTKAQVKEYFHQTLKSVDFRPDVTKYIDMWTKSMEPDKDFCIQNCDLVIQLVQEYYTYPLIYWNLPSKELTKNLDCQKNYRNFRDAFIEITSPCHGQLAENQLTFLQICQCYSLKLKYDGKFINDLSLIKAFNKTFMEVENSCYQPNKSFHFFKLNFCHEVVCAFFIALYITENILKANIFQISKIEAINLSKFLALTARDETYNFGLSFTIILYKIKYLNKTDDTNILRLLKKAELWSKIKKIYTPAELRDITEAKNYLSILEDKEFWRQIDKLFEYEKLDFVKHANFENKKVGVVKIEKAEAKPDIKGITKMRKYKNIHEIQHQLEEFLDGNDSN